MRGMQSFLQILLFNRFLMKDGAQLHPELYCHLIYCLQLPVNITQVSQRFFIERRPDCIHLG